MKKNEFFTNIKRTSGGCPRFCSQDFMAAARRREAAAQKYAQFDAALMRGHWRRG
jgi:hypothetical protein